MLDFYDWFWAMVLTPVAAGYYLWAEQALSGLILSLRQSDVVSISDEDVGLSIHSVSTTLVQIPCSSSGRIGWPALLSYTGWAFQPGPTLLKPECGCTHFILWSVVILAACWCLR